MTHPTPTSPQESTVESDKRIASMLTRLERLLDLDDDDAWFLTREDLDRIRRAISLLAQPSVTSRGLFDKYIIEKADGSPVDPSADYFVLRLDKDENARRAALTYAVGVGGELGRDLVDRCAKYGPVPTRPSVDEEFVMAAKVLRSSAEIVRSCLASGGKVYEAGIEMLERDIHGLDAALASLEGKAERPLRAVLFKDPDTGEPLYRFDREPAQPTAVDERRVGELIEERLKASPFYGVTLRYTPDEFSYRTVPSVEVVKKMIADALERAQAKPVATDPGEDVCTFCGHFRKCHGGRDGACTLNGSGDEIPCHKNCLGFAPAVKGEAVAGWITVEEIAQAFHCAVGTKDDAFTHIHRLLSQRAPLVDVRRLMVDAGFCDEFGHQTDANLRRMKEALAKQSIPTEEVSGG